MRNVDLSGFDIDIVAGAECLDISPLPVFSNVALAFLEDLSKELLKNRATAQFSDVVSFAFWARRANLVLKKEEYLKRGISPKTNVGRGLALHITPSNVPINFAFSYAFALLSGCVSLVRIPSKEFLLIRPVLAVINDVLARHPEVQERSTFASWLSSSPITEELSLLSDVRIIWGGDETVCSIKNFPLSPVRLM